MQQFVSVWDLAFWDYLLRLLLGILLFLAILLSLKLLRHRKPFSVIGSTLRMAAGHLAVAGVRIQFDRFQCGGQEASKARCKFYFTRAVTCSQVLFRWTTFAFYNRQITVLPECFPYSCRWMTASAHRAFLRQSSLNCCIASRRILCIVFYAV